MADAITGTAARSTATAAPLDRTATATLGGTGVTLDAKTAADALDRTGARTGEAADVIAGARERIDALDERIIALVRERMAVSAAIQEARITSGGRRVNLSREMEILGHYRETLGRPGTALAMTLLELCRGRV